MILRSTVTDTDVIAAKRQQDYPLFKARFVNCRFHGVFSGIDFGAVEGCDFTDATLDGCRFFNTDVASPRFPRWPRVVLLDPYRRAADVAAIEWPARLGKYMQICTDKPASVSAAVMHIPSLARLVGCTEEHAREAFEKFGGVVM